MLFGTRGTRLTSSACPHRILLSVGERTPPSILDDAKTARQRWPGDRQQMIPNTDHTDHLLMLEAAIALEFLADVEASVTSR